jgi:116 kDa U5 small nuclear ribonucleoprotein component
MVQDAGVDGRVIALHCMQVPIIAPVKHKKVEVLEKEALRTNYTNDFLAGLLNSNADVIRNIAVVGHLHHGKTTVCGLLVATKRLDHDTPDHTLCKSC